MQLAREIEQADAPQCKLRQGTGEQGRGVHRIRQMDRRDSWIHPATPLTATGLTPTLAPVVR